MADLAREKRDLARRGRRLADIQTQEADKALLHRYADELEQQATDFERDAGQSAAASVPLHPGLSGCDIKLLTRTGLDWSHRYRRTIEALRGLDETELLF